GRDHGDQRRHREGAAVGSVRRGVLRPLAALLTREAGASRLGEGGAVPSQPMTDDEIRAFITADPPHTGKLATVRADGRPHVAPVWYAVDDDGSIVFSTGAGTVKGKNLARTGYAAMSI